VNPLAPPPDAAQRSWPRRLLNRLEVDRAVFYALALRGWQLLAGAVSLLLISRCLSREEQGYYYTFASLLLLQMFFELGMHVVIVSSASHEWSRLRLDERGRVQGDAEARSRLASLAHAVVRWYAMMSLLFVIVVGLGGVLFFHGQPADGIPWMPPWLTAVLLTGLFFWILPLHALLEGCNQVAAVNRFRLIQAIAANVAVWIGLVTGAGLWIVALATLMKLLCDGFLLVRTYPSFFASLWPRPTGPAIRWSRDIWPMQWRLAVSVAIFYHEAAVITPVIFRYHGPVAAGQMGMTWTLIGTLQIAALSWVQARAPQFGMMIASRDFARLDRGFFRQVLISTAALATTGAGVCIGVFVLNVWQVWPANRLLPTVPTVLLVAAAIICHLPRCQDVYFRAHRREPQLLLNIFSSSLIGLLVWQLGGRYGPTGAACGLLAVSLLVTLPAKSFLWYRCRAEWHAE
jgi:hypothetical protein